jgi:phosphonatase-like hydrolase
MYMLPLDLVAFDLTGTTVLDDGAVLSAYRGALEKHGISFSERELAEMRGASKNEVFQTLAEMHLGGNIEKEAVSRAAEAAHGTFKEMLREAYTHGPVAEVPGAEAAIMWLRERGIRTAATTGLDRELRDRVLERLGWREGLFDALVSPDEVLQGRPAPYMIFLAMMRAGVTDVRRVAVVGDTPLDLRAGVNSGASWVVGVLTGAHGLKTLGSTRHTHILDSVAGLPELLENTAPY